ncbi:MAG: hypothetical protein KC419_15535 [Anaerolineales bacterium]|nr:hypothetical protein [Anaerolineales bacterium]MCA9929896.1 hypothetical protein [Anaerolineales bacterium]
MGNSFRKESIDILHEFVKMRFPDPNPDVFTLDSYYERYKLRDSLAEAAVQDIEKSQRVNRRAGNFAHAGLSAFHSGLIYLYEKEDRGARQQFTEARKQWGFIAEPAGLTLAYFAEGIAYHLAMHYEDAMAHYRRANQSLPRIQIVSGDDKPFADKLANVIAVHQEDLHTQLWSPPAAGKPVDTFNQSTTPIPSHQYQGEQYEWFVIQKQFVDAFFPIALQQGGWILVDKELNLQADKLVLVKANEETFDLPNMVAAAPMDEKRPFPFIALLKQRPKQNSFIAAVSPEAQQVEIAESDILGVVVGFWLPAQNR